MIDLDAVAARMKVIEDLCAQAGCSCSTHGELAGIALQLLNENRLLREMHALEERAHGCAR